MKPEEIIEIGLNEYSEKMREWMLDDNSECGYIYYDLLSGMIEVLLRIKASLLEKTEKEEK